MLTLGPSEQHLNKVELRMNIKRLLFEHGGIASAHGSSFLPLNEA